MLAVLLGLSDQRVQHAHWRCADSYAHMGVAHMACIEGCTCSPMRYSCQAGSCATTALDADLCWFCLLTGCGTDTPAWSIGSHFMYGQTQKAALPVLSA